MHTRHLIALLLAGIPCFLVCAQEPVQEPVFQWFKGNLHTHSLWSDGDDFPEMIADWYRDQGYHFLALSDHNILSRGTRWMSLAAIVKRSDEKVLQRYRDRFGDAWVQTRENPKTGDKEVRLKPLDEFRHLLERSGEFIMIQGEEISDRAEGKPVHINATNISEVLSPARGETVREAMQNNLRLILQHEIDSGREVLPHLNHPNFGYAVTAEDLAAVTDERFFEVYNGHPAVNQLGDEDHPSVEKIWDQVNSFRLGLTSAPPLMGIATDDSHEYHLQKGAISGRGWVMVKARFLTPEHLIQAMKRGDFYASSGVELASVDFDKDSRTLSLQIKPADDVQYLTEFVVCAEQKAGVTKIGAVANQQEGTNPRYRMQPGDLYVRARVTSSRPHPKPSFKNQLEQAWTQPVGWEK